MPIRGVTHHTNLKALGKLQKKVVRAIIFNGKFAHSAPLFHRLQILKLGDINMKHYEH